MKLYSLKFGLTLGIPPELRILVIGVMTGMAVLISPAPGFAQFPGSVGLPPPPPITGSQAPLPGTQPPLLPGSQVNRPPQAGQASQAQQPPSPQDQMNQQAQGNFPSLNRGPAVSLGALQRAWDAPYAVDGQISPGIIRYVWRPSVVMAVRTREFMVTTVHLPNFENISSIVVGDPVIFEIQQIDTNVFGVRPNHAGADSNITVLGTSGNVYSFYVRSEGFNSFNISDLTVYVEGAMPMTIQQNALASAGASVRTGGSSSSFVAGGLGGTVGTAQAAVAGRTSNFAREAPDYLRQIAFDPENLQFDMTILAPTPQDAEIAPVRVFHDGVWTYFDFGEKADSVRRPVVALVLDEVDTMVNTRTAGPTGNLLIAEAVGDFTLRNGGRVICVYRNSTLARMRGEPETATISEPFAVNQDQLIIDPAFDINSPPKKSEANRHFLDSISTWFE